MEIILGRCYGINKKEIDDIISQIEKEESVFKKSALDPLMPPGTIMGRKKQTEQLVRYLVGHKNGYVVPYISIYGRSGSGKSSLAKFVCSNVPGISYVLVNLRKAKTVFGAANLILAELGVPGLQNAQGINLAIDSVQKEIISMLRKQGKRLFVLVLDELDAIFYDKRGKPSDFVYKLVVLAEKMREQGLLLCIIGISNNVLSEYGLDDRVRSRIGSSEIFFEPYSKSDILGILKERSQEAFSSKINPKVLEYCADMSSSEHGDARRAIDLLRVSAEIAISRKEPLGISHLEMAQEELQKDRVERTLANASYHMRLVCGGLARVSYLDGGQWYSTSVLYKQYCSVLQKGTRQLGYRRISEMLTDLENTGLVISQTGSKGRNGYGTLYKLVVPPEVVGNLVSKEWWDGIVAAKTAHESAQNKAFGSGAGLSSSRKGLFGDLVKTLEQNSKEEWKRYVGL
ncbi:ORC1-type DNA replication protein [Nitrosotalea sinensis]|uniref:ORC1-type DNA replication protein n=1 Tax=Nitrosotalea sinensis TaxID=1499975 RepID=A0A2H1EFA3_9ARCH|nr:ORC1-type DNA replication protein [Candidatus Nitrosotalea sinensis]